MSKTYLVTPAFCKSALLHDCLAHVYKDGPMTGVEHIVIDNRYPINQTANSAQIRSYANAFGCTYVDSGKDLGLHEGINNAARVVGVKPEDYLAGCDPDDRPSPGFVSAFETVMKADPTIAVLAANFWVIEEPRIRNVLNESVVAGHRVWYHPGVEMWTVCMFNWGFVTKAGGLKQTYGFYGGLESAMSPHMRTQGMRLAYLPDTRADAAAPDRENPLLFDKEYRTWKNDHIAGFKGSFQEWLQENRPGLL